MTPIFRRLCFSLPFLLLVAALPAVEPDKTAPAKGKPTNRLAREISPYLLQHAHNPVDWYPWGPEAFAKAKKENKIVFISIGYSSCHWCHVMEKESFSNAEIAKIMNEKFVCIKVDREERPDIDNVYMTALQVMNEPRRLAAVDVPDSRRQADCRRHLLAAVRQGDRRGESAWLQDNPGQNARRL